MLIYPGAGRADNTTITFGADGLQALGVVMIGAVIDWCKNLPGVPALPSNFLECNGQVVNDANSPINGQAVPDLRGVFTIGSATSGGQTATGSRQLSNASPLQTYTYLYDASNQVIPPNYNMVKVIRIK